MGDEIRVVSSRWFVEELLSLPVNQRRRIRRRLGALEGKGWVGAITDGTIQHIRDGIWEIRVLGRGAAYRIFFFPAPRRAMRMLVLTTLAAKSVVGKQRLLDLEVERAKRRRDDWIEQNQDGGDEA